MSDLNNGLASREDCIREYENHMSSEKQGYYRALESYANALTPLVGTSPFSKEGWKKIISDEGLFNKAMSSAKRLFQSNEVLAKRFERVLSNTRDTCYSADVNGYGLEGWGGGNAVYASSQGAFAIGATPFVIGGWLAAARSEEIFQHIDNKNSMRLEFEYNIDYLQIGSTKYYYPKAYRSGEILGYNKLPKIDWVTPNTSAGGTYTAPESWCGEGMYILLNPVSGASAASAKGNFLTVCKKNTRGYGIEPNCAFTSIKYKGTDDVVKTKRIRLNYDVATGNTNERIFKSIVTLKNVVGHANDIAIDVYMKINLDTGDFTLMTDAPSAAENVIVGLKFDGKVSNIANELTDIPTTGTEKTQFVRECEYRNYAKVSLNEYMADNFRIGANNNISYAAYATDKMLQSTIFNRELEAEDFLINDVLDGDIEADDSSFELYKKMGGFINNTLTFTIGKFVPGLHLQDYKEGLKKYLTTSLTISETDLNLPASVKREWILLGYDPLVAEFPEVKYENAVVDLNAGAEGSAVNENYGFGVDTKCGYIDSLGRSVRIIGNTDSRWRDRGNKIFGALKTYSMEYPFLVYYPHAIRMYTSIDADNNNRTAIYIGGREYRGHFAAGAIELTLNGVLDGNGVPVNNFDAQITSAKTGWANTATAAVSGTISNTVVASAGE